MNLASKLIATVATFALTALVAAYVIQKFTYKEEPVYEEILPTFPAPEELPAVRLPGFRFQHPRLPTPTASEIRYVRDHNPDFFKQHRRAARATCALLI